MLGLTHFVRARTLGSLIYFLLHMGWTTIFFFWKKIKLSLKVYLLKNMFFNPKYLENILGTFINLYIILKKKKSQKTIPKLETNSKLKKLFSSSNLLNELHSTNKTIWHKNQLFWLLKSVPTILFSLYY